MNASEPVSQDEETTMDETSIDRISAELLSAKSRQKRFYVFGGILLLLGAGFIFSVIGFSNGTIIEIQPQDAQETATIKMIDGFGGVIGHTVYSLSKNPTIEGSATGFRPLRKTLQTSETGGTVTLELAELPRQLRITTRPYSDKTRWFIDGRMVAVAAALTQDVFAGEHVVEIDSPYDRKKRIPVTMERGKELALSVVLERIAGHIDITTVPTGASIRINGDLIGISPLSLTKEGGTYHVEVAHDGYQTIVEDVEITNGGNVIERDYRLALQDADVHVHVSPSGGKLLLNGKAVSPTHALTVKALVKNSLVYLKDGYFSQRRTLSVAPGSETRVSFNLKPEKGKVSFFSTPSAIVNLDGKDLGQTPLVLTLSAIPHHLELHRNGYRSYKQTVIPGSKSAQKIRVRLRTELGARLAESPKQYRNPAGIEVKLFRPDGPFVMGAPRYEKGQRANEFLRTVKLTRPFYISTHEVTRAQYGRFKKVQGAPNEPVSSVSWIEAAQYCNWLSTQEKLTPFYDIRNGQLRDSNSGSDGYRLPSEAEWEWLARKAGKSQQTRFTWGDDTTIPPKSGNIADEYAKGKTTHYVPNYSDRFAAVAPVGSYPPEKSGLYDMTGNVSEWVHDVYSLIPPAGQQTEIDPLGAKTGDTHTVKGSNWRSGTMTELRASYREGAKVGRDDIGFRVARHVYGGSNDQH